MRVVFRGIRFAAHCSGYKILAPSKRYLDHFGAGGVHIVRARRFICFDNNPGDDSASELMEEPGGGRV